MNDEWVCPSCKRLKPEKPNERSHQVCDPCWAELAALREDNERLRSNDGKTRYCLGCERLARENERLDGLRVALEEKNRMDNKYLLAARDELLDALEEADRDARKWRGLVKLHGEPPGEAYDDHQPHPALAKHGRNTDA